MPQPPIFKHSTEKLKNAIAAIVGRAIRSIKRLTTALHNRCNLVVYVDDQGRTCCQFLKKDAFSGYHFAFSGNECLVTNKESGEIYTVNFTAANCTCPAFKYDRSKSPCKHIKMVAEVRQDLEQTVLKTQKECDHPKAIIGLDAHYCPDCKKSIEYGTTAYGEILNRDNRDNKQSAKTKKAFEIDPNDVPLELSAKKYVQPSHPDPNTQAGKPSPHSCWNRIPAGSAIEKSQNTAGRIFQASLPTGVRLKRTDDWMCVEYNVDAYGYKNINRERHIVPINIGRIVEHPEGIYTYRIRSGVARVFETVQEALAYLIQVVGTSFDECAAAYWEFNQF